MTNAIFQVPKPVNEPVRTYAPGSAHRASLKAELERQASQVIHIPLIIDGKEIFTKETVPVVMPHDHGHVLANCSIAGPAEMQAAIDAALKAKKEWANMPWEHRAAIFLKAAELVAGPYRDKINASTMLGQSKTAHQAEIDAGCELVDFLRFNAFFSEEIFQNQPQNSPGVWNRLSYRPLDGFIVAITPFNFTAIGANLGSAPAMLGNTVIWKPATTAVLSNYYYMQVLAEAGLPAGVMNFLPSRGSDVSRHILTHPKLGGVHFTGSTAVFQSIWAQTGRDIASYTSYPRLVGETGGKDFVFAHQSADVNALMAALIRGAFEYQGQKCSAASRAFIPRSIWPELKLRLLDEVAKIKQGDVRDFENFLSAVIDQASFENASGFIHRAQKAADAEVLCGGADGKIGYFIHPTIIEAKNPQYETMVKEIFAPILTVYVYDDDQLEETLQLCDTSTVYALTGSVFAQDRAAIIHMCAALENACGNLYINDKPTGAVVGQQPFGGARASGTNDKAGSALNLYRWLSVQTIKETFAPSPEIAYPSMDQE